MKNIIVEEVLPVAELSKLGLYDGSRYLLNETDLLALLSGRRTSLVTLNRLASDAFVIERLEAKLSLNMNEDNLPEIRLHPIYNEPNASLDLLNEEGSALISGEVRNISKSINLPDGTKKDFIFEYDSETKEFVSYDPTKVEVPVQLNGEKLMDEQMEAFSMGRIVQLSDGTMIQHRASEPQGILSSRTALVVTLLKDGSETSFLVKDLSPIMDTSIHQSPFSPGFESAFIQMKKADGVIVDEEMQKRELEDFKTQYSRGYGHGISR